MPKVGPQIHVINDDCRSWLKTYQSCQSRRFAFVFADPPFNIGQDYTGYADNKQAKEYSDFTCEWLDAVAACCSGVMCLHGGDELCGPYLVWAEMSGLQRIAWINWHYRFGQCTRSNWIDARCHCLIYARCDDYTWNPEDVLVESDRVAYGDKRVNETERGGKRLPGTIWGVPSDGPYWGRVQGENKERRPSHPNQLPEVYLARLIRAYTNKGDWILDPFGGSGTTAVVAQALGRNCVTIDISAENCASIKERLEKGAVRVS